MNTKRGRKPAHGTPVSFWPKEALAHIPPGGLRLTVRVAPPIIRAMSDLIYPRSPRETMCGWMHLPRFIDKIRLHLAGKLPPDYQPNFCKGFDAFWLET